MSDVTIIIVTYDRPAWCEVALCSALTTAAVAGVETRILLLDNAGPVEYAEGLAARYGVGYLRMPTNTVEAAPTAFGQVDSAYAAVLYDDDVLLPRWLAAHLEVMAEGYDIVAGSYNLTDADLRVTGSWVLQPATFDDLRVGIVSVNDGSLIRMAAIEGASWRPDLQPWLWLAMWLQLAALGRRFGVVTEPTWLYRQHNGQHTARLDEHDHAIRAAVLAEYAA